MEHELSKIVGKPNDYFFCEKCRHLNWYENEECVGCGWKTPFEKKVLCGNSLEADSFEQWVKNEYDFWIIQEGYSEEEADEVRVEI
jgi:hypothetical protein